MPKLFALPGSWSLLPHQVSVLRRAIACADDQHEEPAMCGRFALFIEAGAFLDIFGCPPPDELEQHYNIVPDRDIAVVRAGENGREAARMRWGLLPPWADEPGDRGRQINARSQTVFDKPTFKSAARRHRCLIPASGFFEWQKGGWPEPAFLHSPDR